MLEGPKMLGVGKNSWLQRRKAAPQERPRGALAAGWLHIGVGDKAP